MVITDVTKSSSLVNKQIFENNDFPFATYKKGSVKRVSGGANRRPKVRPLHQKITRHDIYQMNAYNVRKLEN